MRNAWHLIVVVIVLFMPAGCASAGSSDYRNYKGSSVESLIDDRWRPQLTAEYPSLSVSKSTCPQTLDLSEGRIAHCYVTVNGQRMRIRAFLQRDTHTPYVEASGSLFFTGMVEERIEAYLETTYHVSANVKCPPPSLHVLEARQRLTCAAALPDKQLKVTLISTDRNGNALIQKVANLAQSSIGKLSGTSATLSGALVASYLNNELEGHLRRARLLSPDEVRDISYSAVKCPAKVVLARKRTDVCALRVSGKQMNVAGWVDDKGWHVETTTYAYSLPGLALIFQRAAREQELAAGHMTDIDVHCGRGVVLLAPGQTISCAMSAGEEKGDIVVTILPGGKYRWKAAPSGA